MSFLRTLYNKFFVKKTSFNLYLYQILGFYPRDLSLYSLAFKHKSVHKNNNERLEFLGDTILDTVISKNLFFKFPNKREGELSKLRSKIVNRTFLNSIGKHLELEKHLDFQLNSISLDETNIRGNTFEALIGAIYLDGGIDLAEKYIQTKIIPTFIHWNKIDLEIIDFKSKLIQYSQKENVKLDYILVGEEKTEANTIEFEICVKLSDKEISCAKGTSKKKAEQNASKLALEVL